MAIARVSILVVCLSAFIGTIAKECVSKSERKTHGELYSLNFPKTFPSDYCVRWYISGEPGSVITISFSTLSLPTGPYTDNYNCSHNFIRIGPSPERTICGVTTEPYIKRFDQLRPFVWISFESGPNPFGRGFRLQYVIGPESAMECPEDQFQCDNGKCILRQWCQNGQNECGDYSDEQPLCIPSDGVRVIASTTTPSPSTAVNDVPAGCYHELHSSHGNFSKVLAPRYLSRETSDCSWLIQTSSDHYHVELTLYDMHIPSGMRVEVFDGPSPEFDLLGKYESYSGSYQSLRSSGRSMLVMFQESTTYANWYNFVTVAFKANYHFVRNPTPAPTFEPDQIQDCFHQLVGSRGNFSMPPGPLFSVSDIQDCSWLIQSPDPTTLISLTFPEFDLRGGETVEVFDGDSDSRRSLGVLKTLPRTIHSTGPSMLVKFSAAYFKPRVTTWIVFSASFKAESKKEMCVGAEYSRCGLEDNFACYHTNQSCDGVWDCPLSGKDENGCFGCSPDSFSCGEFGGHRTCFFKHDRCSGTSACENNFDEENCNEELCSESRGKFLCDNKRCILSGWQCDMTDDCGDASDEAGCRMGSSRKVIIAAVVGSLVCSLLLVMALGCACKVYSLRHQPRRRSPRFDTPLSRLQAEMFRRRAPPPPYHEAMLTSRPYDEAVREYLERFPPPHSHQQSDGVSLDPGPERGQDHEALHQTEMIDSESNSVQNLINLMDLSEDGDSSLGNHPPAYARSDPRLEILRHGSAASSSSNSEDEEDEGDDYDLNEHNLASGHMEMETSITAEPNTDNTREDISEDSASATLSADGQETDVSKPDDKDEKDSSLDPGTSTSGDKDDDKKEESDADSVCILCLDDPPSDNDDDDTSDTRCLLQDA